mmetsp:Transcript_7690/g.21826  ORF Transcript_7690/g.21826 Transcript_7690/m.21826 type:complete len:472 (-) Transcript_7690:102-1517(-)|eukprot:CAMPEP_0119140108 /NCGR_PEP_ID=MMETSP1310-20130426/28682_1 /TAXON_ID=464262 /ORGANISM="Genus nov. species nov., Strain RCC2339" /LENGTH=471 /DNA_ID=CAMNT_0007131441 /DNA_START=58 /DNA_END=1473 /DNA_ORIENTATION=+
MTWHVPSTLVLVLFIASVSSEPHFGAGAKCVRVGKNHDIHGLLNVHHFYSSSQYYNNWDGVLCDHADYVYYGDDDVFLGCYTNVAPGSPYKCSNLTHILSCTMSSPATEQTSFHCAPIPENEHSTETRAIILSQLLSSFPAQVSFTGNPIYVDETKHVFGGLGYSIGGYVSALQFADGDTYILFFESDAPSGPVYVTASSVISFVDWNRYSRTVLGFTRSNALTTLNLRFSATTLKVTITADEPWAVINATGQVTHPFAVSPEWLTTVNSVATHAAAVLKLLHPSFVVLPSSFSGSDTMFSRTHTRSVLSQLSCDLSSCSLLDQSSVEIGRPSATGCGGLLLTSFPPLYIPPSCSLAPDWLIGYAHISGNDLEDVFRISGDVWNSDSLKLVSSGSQFALPATMGYSHRVNDTRPVLDLPLSTAPSLASHAVAAGMCLVPSDIEQVYHASQCGYVATTSTLTLRVPVGARHA